MNIPLNMVPFFGGDIRPFFGGSKHMWFDDHQIQLSPPKLSKDGGCLWRETSLEKDRCECWRHTVYFMFFIK